MNWSAVRKPAAPPITTSPEDFKKSRRDATGASTELSVPNDYTTLGQCCFNLALLLLERRGTHQHADHLRQATGFRSLAEQVQGTRADVRADDRVRQPVDQLLTF